MASERIDNSDEELLLAQLDDVIGQHEKSEQPARLSNDSEHTGIANVKPDDAETAKYFTELTELAKEFGADAVNAAKVRVDKVFNQSQE